MESLLWTDKKYFDTHFFYTNQDNAICPIIPFNDVASWTFLLDKYFKYFQFRLYDFRIIVKFLYSIDGFQQSELKKWINSTFVNILISNHMHNLKQQRRQGNMHAMIG